MFFLFRDRHGFGHLGNLGVAALMGLVIALASWQGGQFAQRHGCLQTMYAGLPGNDRGTDLRPGFAQLPVQFAALIQWTGWHYRFHWLLAGYGLRIESSPGYQAPPWPR